MASINYVPTTILLEPDLLNQIKSLARKQRVSLSKYTRDLFAKTLLHLRPQPKEFNLMSLKGKYQHYKPTKSIDLDNLRESVNWTDV